MSELERRLAQLESRVARLELASGTPLPKKSPPPPPHPPSKREPGRGQGFLDWLKQDPLVKLGALFLLIAAGWFVSLAISKEILGPLGRVLLLAAASTLSYGAGLWTVGRRSNVGQTLIVLGMAGGLMAIWAAGTFYGYLSPILTFALMGLLVGGTLLLATARDYRHLALLTTVATALIPHLAGSELRDLGLFLVAYVVLFNVAACFVALSKGWRQLLPICLAATGYYVEQLIWLKLLAWVLPFLIVIYLVYFLPAMRVAKGSDKLLFGDLVTLSLLHVFSYEWIHSYVLIPYHYFVYGLVAAALLYYAAALARRRDLSYKAFWGIIIAGLAGLLVHAAIPFDRLTAAQGVMIYSALAVAVTSYLCYAIRRPTPLETGMALLLAAASAYLLSISDFLSMGILHADLVIRGQNLIPQSLWSMETTAYLSTVAALALSLFIVRHKLSEERPLLAIGVIVLGAQLMELIWMLCHSLFSDPSAAHAIAIIVYACVATGLLYAAEKQRIVGYRYGGYLLFAAILLRLLLMETELMDLTWRIITFAVTGGLLVSTAFFRKEGK